MIEHRRSSALLLIALADVNGEPCSLWARELEGDSFAASRADEARVPHISTSNAFLVPVTA